MAVSIHAPISVDASYTRLWESTIRDRRTALVGPLTMFRLWQGSRSKTTGLSINRMESVYI